MIKIVMLMVPPTELTPLIFDVQCPVIPTGNLLNSIINIAAKLAKNLTTQTRPMNAQGPTKTYRSITKNLMAVKTLSALELFW